MIVCNTFWKRLRGAYGHDIHQGVLLIPCRRVHTFFMRHTISVAYLDADGQVLFITRLPPFSLGPYVPNAVAVLEYSLGKSLTDSFLAEAVKELLILKERRFSA
ncbi:MAG: hypothetical protein DDT32_00431 [Syntrophomonadaceae bacterium]|nr:hypothetical protein [Bacillota bacterium]